MSLSPAALDEAAERLLAARRDRAPIAALPEHCRPADITDGYGIQDRCVGRLCADRGAHRVGYKVGCTSQTAQEMLGASEPFSGQLLSSFVHCGPAVLPSDTFIFRCIEPEFAFRMGADLRPENAPFDQHAVAAAVSHLLPSIEIVDCRFAEWRQIGVPSLVADQGVTGHWVHGAEHPDWTAFDLSRHQVSLIVNGAPCREGNGGNVLGHPLAALTWIANSLARRGDGLRQGEIISTGTCTEVYFAAPGDRVVADFGPILGQAEVAFTPG